MGAAPTMSIRVENIFAISEAGKMSRTTALLTTIPTQPPNASRIRNAMSQPIVGANAQPTEASKKMVNPTSNGFLRPYLSVMGP